MPEKNTFHVRFRSVAITYLYNGVYASSFLNFETLNWYLQVLKAYLICTIKFVIQRLGGVNIRALKMRSMREVGGILSRKILKTRAPKCHFQRFKHLI